MKFAYAQAHLGSHRGSVLRHGSQCSGLGTFMDGVLPLPSHLLCHVAPCGSRDHMAMAPLDHEVHEGKD